MKTSILIQRQEKSFPVPNLTKTQREVFEEIACGAGDGAYRNPKTLEALKKKGAIVEVGQKIICQDRFGTVRVPVYEVPIDLHFAWCQWCSEQLDEKRGTHS